MAASFDVNSPAIAFGFFCYRLPINQRRSALLLCSASCRHSIAGNSAATVLRIISLSPPPFAGAFPVLARPLHRMTHGNHRRQANPATAQPVFSRCSRVINGASRVKRSTWVKQASPAFPPAKMAFAHSALRCLAAGNYQIQRILTLPFGNMAATNSGAKRRSAAVSSNTASSTQEP